MDFMSSSSGMSYCCQNCDEEFSNCFSLKKHLRACIRCMTLYFCGTCGSSFPDPVEFNDHVRVHRLQGMRSLPESVRNAEEHMQAENLIKQAVGFMDSLPGPSGRSHCCQNCMEEYSNSSDLREHLIACFAYTDTYNCETCGHLLVDIIDFNDHVRIHRLQGMENLPAAMENEDVRARGEAFQLIQSLIYKKNSLPGPSLRSHCCQRCRKEFSDCLHLRKHLHACFAFMATYNCTMCRQIIPSIIDFNDHLRRHNFEIMPTPKRWMLQTTDHNRRQGNMLC